jgi:hypothetical protein
MLTVFQNKNAGENKDMSLVLSTFDIIDLVLTGKGNIVELKNRALSMLEVLNLDDNIGFFITILLSRNNDYSWQYKS